MLLSRSWILEAFISEREDVEAGFVAADAINSAFQIGVRAREREKPEPGHHSKVIPLAPLPTTPANKSLLIR